MKKRLNEALMRSRCVPILGAGVSISAGGPTWKGHLHQLCEDFDSSDPKEAEVKEALMSRLSHETPLIELAGIIVRSRTELRKLPMAVRLPAPSPLHFALASLQCPLYLTTNFDDGMEQAFRDQRRSVKTLNNDQLDCLYLNHFDHVPSVVKLCSSNHGDGGGALTNRDFAELIHSNTAGLRLLQMILHDSVALFVGCSMRDPLIMQALQRSSYSGIGRRPHVALMPDTLSDHDKLELMDYGVEVVSFDANNLTNSIGEFLGSLHGGRWPPDTRRNMLLIFEPGTPAKSRLILEAISKILPVDSASLARLGIITERLDVAAVFEEWRKRIEGAVEVTIFHVKDVADTKAVLKEVASCPLNWTSILCTSELTMEYAAHFADAYKKDRHTDLSFFTSNVVEQTRNKIAFRDFVRVRFKSHGEIAGTQFKEVPVDHKIDKPRDLWQRIQAIAKQEPAWQFTELVAKPINASGSRGVRPISLASRKKKMAVEALEDLLDVLSMLSHVDSTRRCCTDRLLLEQRLRGEEFSVEGRITEKVPEILCVHWKPGIDADPLRFFERIYVTLPNGVGPSDLLKRCTAEIVQKLGLSKGVFHAEFRVNEDGTKVYPIEIGLRPGGGSVCAQVLASCGIDLFEAAVRSSLGIGQVPVQQEQRIVASAEVFADIPGVLPPLQIRDVEGKFWALRAGDEEAVKALLNGMLGNVDRALAQNRLAALLKRDSPFSNDVLNAFSAEGAGLAASVDSFDIWMQPGDIVQEEEATYLAGMRIIANAGLDPVVAVAETLAAIEICYDSVACKPISDLRSHPEISL